MPDKHIWLTDEAADNLRRLARRWGLDSDSAVIQEALKRALDSDS